MAACQGVKYASAMSRGYVHRWLAACALAVILSGPATAAEPWVVKGRVVGVADGDSVTILDLDNRQHKIRLNGIDAPERGQPSGFRSKENLSKLVYDRNVLAECGKRTPMAGRCARFWTARAT